MKESSKKTMNIVGVNSDAQKKLKLLSKVNQKNMGSMVSEIILNYGGNNSPTPLNDMKDWNKEIEFLIQDLKRFVMDCRKPWYKRLFS